MREHDPRSATVLLTRALDHVGEIQPEAAQEPIRMMLRAGIERCTILATAGRQDLVGEPINFLLALAYVLTETDHHTVPPQSGWGR